MLVFREAEKNEQQRCTAILKDAFGAYDFFKIYGNDRKRERVFFETMMEVWMKNSFAHGRVLLGVEDGEIIAVAVLKAPKDAEIGFVDFSLKSLKLWLAGGIRRTGSFLKMCETSDEACCRLPEPKWHLVLLAVSGKWKGKGVGSAMLQMSILPYIAQHGGGLLTFNTNAEENRNFYRKNGFDEFDADVLYENGKELGNWSYKKVVETLG